MTSTAINSFPYHWALHYNDSLKQVRQTPAVKNDLKLAHLLSYAPHISLQELHTIHCPTLVIGGDHDIIPAAAHHADRPKYSEKLPVDFTEFRTQHTRCLSRSIQPGSR